VLKKRSRDPFDSVAATRSFAQDDKLDGVDGNPPKWWATERRVGPTRYIHLGAYTIADFSRPFVYKKGRDFDEIHAYVGNPTGPIQAGISAISEMRWTAAQGANRSSAVSP
jgi:hypothetical protein